MLSNLDCRYAMLCYAMLGYFDISIYISAFIFTISLHYAFGPAAGGWRLAAVAASPLSAALSALIMY